MTDRTTTDSEPTGSKPANDGTGGRTSRRALLRRGGVVLGSVAVAGCLGSGSSGGPDDSSPALVAHRGCAAEHPENTVAAVEAVAPVVDRIELDVRRCGTGELVAFHDERLGRVTDASGRVDRTSVERLSEIDVDGSGEPIPTLTEAFEAAPADTALMLDLKEPGLAAGVLTLHAGHGHDLLLTSDRRIVIEEIQAVDSGVPTAYAVRESLPNRLLRPAVPGLPAWLYAPEDVAGVIERTTALGCDAISPRYELCLRTGLVERAHEAGLRVLPWTIASRRAFESLGAVGVDAVISDVCDGLR